MYWLGWEMEGGAEWCQVPAMGLLDSGALTRQVVLSRRRPEARRGHGGEGPGPPVRARERLHRDGACGPAS